MREITKYVANDGKEFFDAEGCRMHEVAVIICERVGPTLIEAYRERLYPCVLAVLKAGYAISLPSDSKEL